MHPHTVLSRSLSLLVCHVINLLPLSHCYVRNGVKRQLRRGVHEPRRDSGTRRSLNLNGNPRTNPCLLRCRPTVQTLLSCTHTQCPQFRGLLHKTTKAVCVRCHLLLPFLPSLPFQRHIENTLLWTLTLNSPLCLCSQVFLYTPSWCRDSAGTRLQCLFFLFFNSETNKFMHKWEVNSKQNEALIGKQISNLRSLILQIVIVIVMVFSVRDKQVQT